MKNNTAGFCNKLVAKTKTERKAKIISKQIAITVKLKIYL